MTRILVPTYKCDKCGGTEPESEFGHIPTFWYQTSRPGFIGYLHACSLECLASLISPDPSMEQT